MAVPPELDPQDEFAVIARYFAPLATGAAARGLIDDVALLAAPGDMVVTTDAIVEGVHFLPGDPLDLVARKALRVNLSDIAAKGARATGYLLTLMWPDARDPRTIADLAAGLADDQRHYGLALLGGDTTRTPGPLSLSVAMFAAPGARTPARADARIGDDVWVTGTIGDAGLGLDARRGNLSAPATEHYAFLERRYLLPDPRTMFAPVIAAFANASCDVSDGLLADAGKIASASGAALDLGLAEIPLSPAAAAWTQGGEDRIARLCAAGDDYEILFTAPAGARAEIAARAAAVDVTATRIGAVRVGAGARLIGASGPVSPPAEGYAHRLGAPTR